MWQKEEKAQGNVSFCSINFHPFINHDADDVIKVNHKIYYVVLKIYFLYGKMNNSFCLCLATCFSGLSAD